MNKTILTILLFCFAVFSVRAQVENAPKTTGTPKSAVEQSKTVKENPNEKGAVQENPQANNPNAPVIKFDKMEHDYGILEQNADGTSTFTFVNVGKEPLILSNVRSS